ncbi:TIM barrel protein [Nitrospiraceae bacterium AH_259_D15_M11_P09]|nr:TIM barrel protein [Nitrospiraceae bacterium AH_259_D15_M11_P09]
MIGDKIQAFPLKTWREEFAIARDLGLDVIEWVVDTTDVDWNPLLTVEGRREINRMQEETGIKIPVLCADYLMEIPLCSDNLAERLQSLGMLYELIRVAPEVGIKHLEIPLLGKLDINDLDKEGHVVDLLLASIPSVVERGLGILLELGLPPNRVISLLEKLPGDVVKINYDMGNSAYFGFDAEEEFSEYGQRVGNAHIKDCTPEDYSVPLGKGNVNFTLVSKLLSNNYFTGDFILQAYRQPGRDPVEEVTEYMDFVKSNLLEYMNWWTPRI